MTNELVKKTGDFSTFQCSRPGREQRWPSTFFAFFYFFSVIINFGGLFEEARRQWLEKYSQEIRIDFQLLFLALSQSL